MATIAKSFRPTRLFLVASLGLLPAAARAGQEVVVELKSGRTLVAEVDVRTSTTSLWLRFAAGSTEILRPIEWNRVERAIVAAEELDAAAFRIRAMRLRSQPKRPAKHSTQPGVEQLPPPTVWLPHVPPPQIQSVWADAHVANWDDDVAADGLVLHVVPLDAFGGIPRVDGSVEAELWDITRKRRRKLAHWTCHLSGSRLGPNGYVTRLPFQAAHPEFNLSISSHALLHIRFSAPGHGTFRYSLPDVRVRPYSAARDRLQQRTRRRFMLGENP